MNSRRPRNQIERRQCLDATAHLAEAEGLHPVIAAILVTTYCLPRQTYVKARARAVETSVALALARACRNVAVVAFDIAFRRWSNTVEDAEAKSLAPELTTVLGAAPSAFLRLKPRTKIAVMENKLPILATSPTLHGDPVCLEALRVAAQALETAVPPWEAAFRARRAAVKEVVAAAKAFDSAYGKLAEAILTYDPNGVAEVPMFHRTVSDDEVVDDEAIETADDADDPIEAEEVPPTADPPSPEPAAAPEPSVDPVV